MVACCIGTHCVGGHWGNGVAEWGHVQQTAGYDVVGGGCSAAAAAHLDVEPM